MNTLTFKKIAIKSADLGETNCLPDIHNNSYIRSPITLTDNITEEEREFIGKGMISTLLPYQTQDMYNRKRSMKEFDGAVLENDYLIATFITELGGRLWSLYDKRQKRELLYNNDVFQPANLALRNAWFSGGVEWNVGIKGHNPLTCSPMFAKEVINTNNEPVLIMYEYERIRGVVYSVSATLKEDVLLVNVQIENTSDEDKYMYWWSNIAVDETKDTRVIVPTEETFICSYSDGEYILDTGNLPYNDDIDVTYASNISRSRDFFYKIPKENDKWIAAVKGDGTGLLQFSDKLLEGRKMFVWGQQQGGRHWNNWLSDRGDAYIEIQAGLKKTQLEHFLMKANSKIAWTEGYSFVSANPDIVHGNDYSLAIKEIERNISYKFDLLKSDAFSVKEKKTISLYGSGWGALENRIRNNKISNELDFPEESMNDEQKYWLMLLNGEKPLKYDTNYVISSYTKGKFWIEKLNELDEKDWYAYNQLGILYYIEDEYYLAKTNFLKSIECEKNPWALRNLSQIEKNIYKNVDIAGDYMTEAIKLKSDYVPILTDCASALIAAGRYQEWVEIYMSLDDEYKNNGRIKMLLSLCYVKLGELDMAAEILTPSLVVDDIKEGEYALSTIWVELYTKIMARDNHISEEKITMEDVMEKYPLPYELDFRMH